jgi:hypothetical protein
VVGVVISLSFVLFDCSHRKTPAAPIYSRS